MRPTFRVFFVLLVLLAGGLPVFAGKIDSLQRLLARPAPDTLRAARLIQLGTEYHMAGKPDSARLLVQQGIVLAQQSNDFKQVIHGYAMLGFLKSFVRNDTGATRTFATGLLLASQHPEVPKARAGLYMAVSAFLGRTGQGDRALDYGLQALRYYRSTRDTVNLLGAMNNLGIAFQSGGMYDSAIVYQREMMRIARKKGVQPKILSGLTNIGNAYVSLNQLDSAEYYLRRADTLALQLNQKGVIARNRMCLGVMLTEQGLYQQARQVFRETLPLAESLSQYDAMFVVLNHCVNENHLGNYAEVIVRARPIHAVALETRNYTLQRLAADVLADALEKTGRYKEATVFLRSYHTASDSLLNEERIAAMGRLRTDFEIANQQEKIALLQRQADAEKEATRANRWIMVLLTAGLCTTGIFMIALVVSIRRRRRLNEALAAQKSELEALNTAKDRLFSLLSHDLRSPLSSLSGILGLLQQRHTAPEDAQLLSMGTVKLHSILHLMDNLLAWSSGLFLNRRHQPTRFALATAGAEALETMEEAIKLKYIRFEQTISPDTEVFADYPAVVAIIRNLIANAVKFTPSRGSIVLGVSEVASRSVTVFVRDTGVGMPAQQVAALWSRPGSTAGTNGEAGTGIGLMLCKELAEANGGSIRVESALGVGTTFLVQLPG